MINSIDGLVIFYKRKVPLFCDTKNDCQLLSMLKSDKRVTSVLFSLREFRDN